MTAVRPQETPAHRSQPYPYPMAYEKLPSRVTALELPCVGKHLALSADYPRSRSEGTERLVFAKG